MNWKEKDGISIVGVKSDKHGKVLAALKMSELESLLNTIPKKRRLSVINEIEKRKIAGDARKAFFVAVVDLLCSEDLELRE